MDKAPQSAKGKVQKVERLLARTGERGRKRSEKGAGRNRTGVSLPHAECKRKRRGRRVRGSLRYIPCYGAFLTAGAPLTGLASFFALALATNAALTFCARASVSTSYTVAASHSTLGALELYPTG